MEDAVPYESLSEEAEEKSVRLSLHLLVKRHLPAEAEKWDHEQIVLALNKITHLRLDRERIKEIDNLELLGDNVTNVYLQTNRIERLENLECLTNLTFLTLSNNKVKVIENLKHLKRLIFLDLSENKISSVEVEEVPQSVIILNLLKNPCAAEDGHRLKLVHGLRKLKQLDLCDVSNRERREVGLEVSSDDDDDDEDDEANIDEEDNKDKEDTQQRLLDLNKVSADDDFRDIATAIILRSQSRLEANQRMHKRRETELDDLRTSCNMPQSSRSLRSSQKVRKSKSKR